MLVGLGSAGVVSLSQVMGIVLGTGIGTTLTVQLLSLNIAQFGLFIFSACFSVYFLTSKASVRRAMGVGMGFGLIFWGLEMIGWGTQGLRDIEMFTSGLDYIRQNPIVLLLVAAGITALVHSSAVTVGFAMSLAASGLLDLNDAFFIVYGANLGTTATALMAAAGGNYVGRQIAWAHCFHKIASVGIFYFLTPYAADFISTGSPARDVANAHLFFNLVGAVMFYPFINKGAALVEKFIQPGANDREFSAKFLDRMNYDSPSVCLAHAEREIMRMGDIVLSMIRDSLNLLRNENQELIEDMKARDNKVDLLNREISLFLTRTMDHQNGDVHRTMVRYVTFASDLESAADVIENSILELAHKKHHLKLEFSAEGWADIEKLQSEVYEVCALSLSCFQTQSKELATTVVSKKREIRKIEKDLRESHIERLAKGMKDTIKTSSIHMDALSDYRRIVGLMSNHVYPLLRNTEEYNITAVKETK
jgi:phosphate:Na+ symporter